MMDGGRRTMPAIFRYVMLSVLILLSTCGVSTSQPFNSTEFLALRDFFVSTGGERWIWNDDVETYGIPWDFETPSNPCVDFWQGVFCTDNNTELFSLDLVGKGLSGVIPNTFASFSNLVYVGFDENTLSGTIPSFLLDMPQLAYVYLPDNRFSGALPNGCFEKFVYFDVSDNLLTGTLPNDVTVSALLQSINLGGNQFTGTIPASLFNIAAVSYMDLSFNKLTETIPAEIPSNSAVYILYLMGNALTGSIPNAVYEMSALQYFIAYDNRLNGTVSPHIGESRLVNFIVNENLLSGTLPAELFDVASLTNIDLSVNRLTGTLPGAIYDGAALVSLYLGYNDLNGSIPEILRPTELQVLDISTNSLIGSLPPSLFNSTLAPSLQMVSLYDNQLTGTVPIGIFSGSPNLLFVDLSTNMLTGTAPFAATMTKTLAFLCSYNMLSGTVPSGLSSLALASAGSFNGRYSVAYNYLTGTMPSGLSARVNISGNFLTGTLPEFTIDTTQLTVTDNFITGTIPRSIINATKLGMFEIDNNLISGSIPDVWASLDGLTFFSARNNMLTGTVPGSLGMLSFLATFVVFGNQLHGRLTEVFPLREWSWLDTLDVGSNRFTGEVPGNIFAGKLLRSAYLSDNCFTGTLPIEVCRSSTVKYLGLSGLHSAPTCTKRFFPEEKTSETYYLEQSLGSIPACYMSMPSVVSLQLAGNGLTGPIPTLNASSLTQLSLVCNELHGTLPPSFANNEWKSLELGNNKLSGVLRDLLLADQARVSLQVNRFSGTVPSSLLAVQDIEVLDGNMFDCEDSDKEASLPVHDASYDKYQCGSNAVNASIYAWIVLAGTGVACAAVLLLVLKNVSVLGTGSKLKEYRVSNLDRWLDFNASIIRAICVCVLPALTALLIVFAVLSHYKASYTHKYAWSVSVAYLNGTTAGVVVFVTMFAVLCGMAYAAHVVSTRSDPPQQPSPSPKPLPFTPVTAGAAVALKPASPAAMNYTQLAALTAAFLVNLAVTGAVNAGFVYLVINHPSNIVTMAEVAMSLFKLFWNRYGTVSLLRMTNGSKTFLFNLFLMETLNSILIPCIATAAISTQCFYNVLVDSPKAKCISSQLICTRFDYDEGSCATSAFSFYTTYFSPPFVYSYQCSSVLLTNYATVFVYGFIIATFGKPFLNGCRYLIQQHAPAVWRAVVPRSLQQAPHDDKRADRKKPQHIVHVASYMRVLFKHWTVLVTFGVLFPPLGFIACVAVAAHVKLTEHTILHHMAGIADETARREARHTLQQNLAKFNKHTESVMRVTVVVAALFYSLFIFDIFGNWRQSLPAMLVMIALSLIMYAIPHLSGIVCRASAPKAANYAAVGKRDSQSDVELQLQAAAVVSSADVLAEGNIELGTIVDDHFESAELGKLEHLQPSAHHATAHQDSLQLMAEACGDLDNDMDETLEEAIGML